MGGVGLPPEGSQYVAITKGDSPCSGIETNPDFVDRGSFFQKTICAFVISFILMRPDANFAAHKQLLEKMEKSFKTF
jgi:hypothetical protein